MGAGASIDDPKAVDVYDNIVKTVGPLRDPLKEGIVRENLHKMYQGLVSDKGEDEAMKLVREEYRKHADIGTAINSKITLNDFRSTPI